MVVGCGVLLVVLVLVLEVLLLWGVVGAGVVGVCGGVLSDW